MIWKDDRLHQLVKARGQCWTSCLCFEFVLQVYVCGERAVFRVISRCSKHTDSLCMRLSPGSQRWNGTNNEGHYQSLAGGCLLTCTRDERERERERENVTVQGSLTLGTLLWVISAGALQDKTILPSLSHSKANRLNSLWSHTKSLNALPSSTQIN